MFRSDEFLYDVPNVNPGGLKILFMDIDGVLQPIGNKKRFRHDLKALHNHFISINKKYDNCISYRSETYEMVNKVGLRK